jgi:hypothetical protein
MNSDNRNKKDLLKERDPELVDDYYSRAVQPVARQPIVQSQQAFDTMVLKLRATITELENLNTSESSEKAADIAEGLSSIKTVLNYRGNTYSGPAFFCTNCCECVGPKGNQEHSDLGHIVAKQDTNKPYPGFASQPNTRGLGQPGLFSRCGLSFQKNIQLYGGIVQTMEERLELINNGVTEHTKKGVPAGDPQVYAAWKEERNGTERDRIAVRYPSISDEERKKRLISVGIEPSIYASQLSDVGYGFYQIRIPHDNTCLCANCIIARSTDFLELKFCFPVGDDTVPSIPMNCHCYWSVSDTWFQIFQQRLKLARLLSRTKRSLFKLSSRS